VESRLKREKKYRRHKRVRAKIFGTARRPRLCVFRSANHIYAQLVDDEKGKTVANASNLNLKSKVKSKKLEKEAAPLSGKLAIAYEVGQLIAKKALEKKIEKVVFDRGGYQYHGRVKALAEGARQGGLRF
jgi:large subunit ribosomal protein L18